MTRLRRGQRVEVEEELNNKLPAIVCDAALMRQAIMNIIANACQAMSTQEADRDLFIATWVEDHKVCLSIEDTGPGISEELRESVFETFFSTKGQSGTGLGLGVVRNVMRRFNGTVNLEDGRRGSGARFVIRMPVVK